MRWLPILRVRALTFLHEPLAALISLQTLQNALHTLGYPAVTLFIMIESAGIPFPGETMLLLASFYSAIDHQLKLPIIIACAAFGAIAGDNIGYFIGRTGGRAFVERFGRYLFLQPKHLDRAEKFFARHGDKTVFFGRFIAVLRAWAAFLAGVNHMNWRSFLIYNAVGGILWAIIYGTIGYVAGRVFHDNFTQVEHIARTVSWIGAGVIIATVIAIFFVVRSRRKQSAARSRDDKRQQDTKSSTTTSSEPASPPVASMADSPASTSKADAGRAITNRHINSRRKIATLLPLQKLICYNSRRQ
ncbi:MAG: DedA family protein [Chloroflexi bacterium]|nr:MAG: DedA family protein [Chloroflexota bacterium]